MIFTGKRWVAGCMVKLLFVAGIGFHGAAAIADAADDYTQGHKRYLAGDVASAMPLLKKAADAGHAAAQALLGRLLDQSDLDEEAVSYYRKSAEQGNDEGQLGLGVMLSTGEGGTQDLSEGRKWITLSAEQGNKQAINELATAYIRGGLAISDADRKGEMAQRWIKAAAENGYLSAMDALAVAYREGSYGFAADSKMAEFWTEKARKAGGAKSAVRNAKSGRSGEK